MGSSPSPGSTSGSTSHSDTPHRDSTERAGREKRQPPARSGDAGGTHRVEAADGATEHLAPAARASGRSPAARRAEARLDFVPDRGMTDAEARALLLDGDEAARAELVSNLLCYAPWDRIWSYVSRDEVRALFPHLDLAPNLRAAWARILGVGDHA